jgi:Ca2+-binding EF-hand superfamily protein
MVNSFYKYCVQQTQMAMEQLTTPVSSYRLTILEFLAATMSSITFLKDSYLRTAFKMFDKDGSGKID